MQPSEIEKIRQLVKTSSLLSQPEKEEWLALAGIMNDKQLWELRKILEPLRKSQESRVKSQESGVIRQEPKTITTPSRPSGEPPLPVSSTGQALEKEGMKLGVPPMKHIINLPKAGSISNFQFPISKEKTSKTSLPKEQTGFWKRIKDVLAEKELPPGHPEPSKELQLPPHIQTSDNRLSAGLSADKAGKAGKPEREKREERVEKGKMGQAKLAVPRPPTAPKPPQKPIALPVAAKSPLPLYTTPPSTTFASKVVLGTPPESGGDKKATEDKLFVPGLKDTRILVEAKLAKPKALPHPVITPSLDKLETSLPISSAPVAGQALVKERIKTGEGSSSNINNLDQVSGLTPKDVNKDLAQALKHLAANFGYHQILQALEKSPIFTAYIKTGLEALAGKGDLDRQSGDYLKREEFERFVDVLRSIKN